MDKINTTLCFFCIWSLTFLASELVLAEQQEVLSRNYVGIGVEVNAPPQCYPGENVTLNIKVKALEDIRNVSVSVFIWGSESEGLNPWSTSFTVLDVTDFPNGTTREETYNLAIPPKTDPGLTYGILFLNWSISRASLWQDQWDKVSFRATYVRNGEYEDLQAQHSQLEIDLSNSRVMAYILAATTIASAISGFYVGKKRK
jgi:hypothetical protein